MNKRRVIQHAKGYLDLLSKGIDPISQKEVDPASIVAEPRLQKCFAFVSDLLEELLANDGHVALSYDGADTPPNASAPKYELVRKKDPFRLSQAQRGRVMIAKGPVTPITFVNHINRVIDSEAMEKLSIKSINTWLLKNEYISQTKQPAVITKTVMKPMLKAADIGIEEAETTDPKTGEIKSRIVLTQKAQQFLLDNLDRILEET
jgi:hypothetical protein